MSEADLSRTPAGWGAGIMGKCDITGGILGFGLNKFAESQGLKPLPAGAGLAIDLDPGFIVKQEVKGLCKPGTGRC